MPHSPIQTDLNKVPQDESKDDDEHCQVKCHLDIGEQVSYIWRCLQIMDVGDQTSSDDDADNAQEHVELVIARFGIGPFHADDDHIREFDGQQDRHLGDSIGG
jgi:hypothetical protein